MVLTTEYRVLLPMSTSEYQVAHLYSVAEQSKDETGGGEGVEILKNEPFVDNKTGKKGQYTYKKISKSSRVPALIRKMAPEGSLTMFEESWNTYPDYKTTVTNGYLKDKFHITITSRHLPYTGKFENPHHIPEDSNIERVLIDIANDSVGGDSECDPSIFISEKTGRGALGETWIDKGIANLDKAPMMCCYKLVEVEFKVFLVQTQFERIIQGKSKQIVTFFFRQLFCWMDKWYGMTIDEIRELEETTKKELDDMYAKGKRKGMKLEEIEE